MSELPVYGLATAGGNRDSATIPHFLWIWGDYSGMACRPTIFSAQECTEATTIHIFRQSSIR